mmetsp:Transcript_51936/g.103362  ORF Transcript_51936/g.103362 Transcript_51936/m.103362 type:complete len:308 (-) Transcript_51936:372-1295(-)
MPLLISGILLDDGADALRQLILELDVARHQVGEELLHEHLDVGLVDQRVDQFQRALANGRIIVLQAVDYRVAVALDGLGVLADDLVKGIERHVPDVVVTIDQEAAKDVNGEHAQTRFHLNGHNSEHTLVEDGVARVFGGLGIGGHLCEDVVHLVRGLCMAGAEDAKHAQDLDLQKGIDDAMHVMLRGIPGEDEVLQRSDEGRRVLPQLRDHIWLDQTHLTHQLERGEKHSVVARAEQSAAALKVRVDEFRAFAQDADRAERGLLGNERVGSDHQLLDLGREVAANFRGGDVANRAARQASNVLILRL